MKKILILTIIQILLFNCKTLDQNNKNMEKIDLKKFKNKNILVNHTYREETDDTIVEYELYAYGDRDIISVNTYKKDSPYYTKKTYYRSNNQLMAESSYFYRTPIGISKKYDEKGNLTEEIDWAKLEKRTFSIDDLIKKMKDEFDIDLLNPKNKEVSRGGNPTTYYYSVAVKKSDQAPFFRLIEINVQTGELISDKIIYRSENYK